MKKWLSPEQKARLKEVMDDAVRLYSWDGVIKKTGCSGGALSGIHSGGSGVSEAFALYLCKELGVNPFYVTDGIGQKYKKWDDAFMGRSSGV